MTEYNVRYFDKKHLPHMHTVLAKDVSHAITQFKELMPDMTMTSVLPSDQWHDD